MYVQAEMTEDTDMQEAARVEPKSEAAAPSPSVGAAAPGPSPATATPHATPVEEEGGAVPVAEVTGAAAVETAAGAAAAPGPVTTPASQVFSPRLPGYEVPPFPAFPAAAAAAAAPVVEEAAAAAAAPSIVPRGATEIRDVPPESDAPELPLSMLDTTAHLGLPIAGGRAAAAADEEEESIDVHRVVTDPDSPRGTGGPTGEAAQVPATGEEEARMAEPAKGGREAPSGGADDEALVPEQ
jgi:ribonuclease E